MNTLNFLDANVWLALLWSRHAHSEKATAWFEHSGEEQFFFCRFTPITVLRLLTTDQIMGKDARARSEAWSLWDRIWADTRCCVSSRSDAMEKEFRSRSRLSTCSPKVWADAYLLAFAAVAGLKFITFDRALKSQSANVFIL